MDETWVAIRLLSRHAMKWTWVAFVKRCHGLDMGSHVVFVQLLWLLQLITFSSFSGRVSLCNRPGHSIGLALHGLHGLGLWHLQVPQSGSTSGKTSGGMSSTAHPTLALWGAAGNGQMLSKPGPLPAWSPAGSLWMPWPSWPSCPSWPGWSSWKSWPWLELLVAGSWGTQWQAGQQLAAQ